MARPRCPRCEAESLTKHCASPACSWQWCDACRFIIGDAVAQRWIPGPGAQTEEQPE